MANKPRLGIFIDGNNLRHGIKALLKTENIHWKTFIDLIKKDYKLVGAKYYIGKIRCPLFEDEKLETQDTLLKDLNKAGIEIWLGYFNDQKQEKGVDVQMALDIVMGAFTNLYDKALLISGDGDLGESVKIAQDFGVEVIIGYIARIKNERYRISTKLKSIAKSTMSLNTQIRAAYKKLKKRKKDENLLIFSDGGSRGNPGPAGCGAIITDSEGKILKKISEYIGHATNNKAEYHALLLGLNAATQFKTEKINCYLDSELIVKQLNGVYKIKNQVLKEYYEQVKLYIIKHPRTSFHHIPREKNTLADKLANDAIDRAKK